MTSGAGDSALAPSSAVLAGYGPLEDRLLSGPCRFHRLESVANPRHTTSACRLSIMTVRTSRHAITPALIL